MSLEQKKILVVYSDAERAGPLKDAIMQRGGQVVQAESAEQALEFVAKKGIDAVVSEQDLAGTSGEDLLRKLRANSTTETIPFLLITDQKILDDRIRVIELGVDDCIPKPCHPQEVVARLQVILSEIENANQLRQDYDLEPGFSGTLSEMGLLDLIQIFEVSSKSGILYLRRDGQEGQIFLADGQVMDAKLNDHTPDEAINSMLVWPDGQFHIKMCDVQREKKVSSTTRELLSEGLHRVGEWRDLTAALPALDTLIERGAKDLNQRSLSSDDEQVLSLLDAPLTISELLQLMGGDFLRDLRRVRKLLQEGWIRQSADAIGGTPKDLSGSLNSKDSSFLDRNRMLARAGSLFEGDAPKLTKISRQQRDRSQARILGRYTTRSFPSDSPPRRIKTILTRAELLLIRERLS